MGQVTPGAEARFRTRSPDETMALGEKLGRLLQPGDFVGLIGDLGAGKTRFVRGVARGAEVPPEEVASPTFAIVYPYAGARVKLHHADLYRLADRDELYSTGFYDLIGKDSAVLVEWVDKIPDAVPEDALLLHFSAPDLDDEDLREIHARAFGPKSAERLRAWQTA